MEPIVGKIKISDWEDWKPIEIRTVDNLLEIRVWISRLRSAENYSSHLSQACRALKFRKVYYREVEGNDGIFLYISALKYGDPIDYLQYAFGRPVVLQEDLSVPPPD